LTSKCEINKYLIPLQRLKRQLTLNR